MEAYAQAARLNFEKPMLLHTGASIWHLGHLGHLLLSFFMFSGAYLRRQISVEA